MRSFVFYVGLWMFVVVAPLWIEYGFKGSLTLAELLALLGAVVSAYMVKASIFDMKGDA